VVRGRVALVGDAGGYVDAITGEGISVGLRQAIALADAVAAGDLARYRAAHRQIVRVPNAIVRLTLALERRGAVRRRVLAALARDPRLFERLLGIHAGLAAARSLGVGGALRLGAAWLGVAGHT
jgi:flavin-dependent dehydrogenase